MNLQLSVNNTSIAIRAAEAAELIDLRHRILRAGLPRDAAIFPCDREPATKHFGAFIGEVAVGCATFQFEPYEDQPAWRLRGMATDDKFRGKGIEIGRAHV